MRKRIKKIADFFRRKYPEPHCKKCKYYIAECEWVKALTNERINGQHICGQSMLTEINELGDEVFRKYGELEKCTECGMPVNDHQQPVFRSCRVKNHLKKCKDFAPMPILQILHNSIKSFIIKIIDMINAIKVNDFFILVLIIGFQAWFVATTGLYTFLVNKDMALYIIIEAVLFIYLIKKK